MDTSEERSNLDANAQPAAESAGVPNQSENPAEAGPAETSGQFADAGLPTAQGDALFSEQPAGPEVIEPAQPVAVEPVPAAAFPPEPQTPPAPPAAPFEPGRGTSRPTQAAEPVPVLRQPGLILLVALVAAIAFDLAFFDQSAGLQWAIFIHLAILGLLAGTLIEKKHIPWQSILLMVPLSLSSIATVFRSETFTLMSLVIFGLTALVLLAASYLSGEWIGYRLREYLLSLFNLIGAALIGLPRGLMEAAKAGRAGGQRGKSTGKGLLAVLRGVLLAIPLLLIFGALFSAADQVFAKNLEGLFAWLRLDNWDRLLPQAILVGILTWMFFGGLWFALTHSIEKRAPRDDQPAMPPFLGMTESTVILLSLNLLFAAFLLIQFRYFFAGQANITQEGFTYAEYARRGFFELLGAGGIAWLVHYALSSFTKREKLGQRLLFSLLASVLIAQVGVVLVSAYMRLGMYEQAYGFTQSRLVAHWVIILLGAVLLGSLLMEWTHALRHMALVLFVALMVFALGFSLMNADATIARLNLNRAAQGEDLDASFLVYSLSEDATGRLFNTYNQKTLPAEQQQVLGYVLSCRAARFAEAETSRRGWASWSWPRENAQGLYTQNQSVLLRSPLGTKDGTPGFNFKDEWIYCGAALPEN
jgi:hypothetical protein